MHGGGAEPRQVALVALTRWQTAADLTERADTEDQLPAHRGYVLRIERRRQAQEQTLRPRQRDGPELVIPDETLWSGRGKPDSRRQMGDQTR